ncbi:MAG: glycosyltransferase family 4 protein [Acidimicrobiia bacterium]|nr:glycosyltransferase family 4 protein [Acidimicrobiia bacterium]
MDVVVCGAQVPFVRGGAELHMENLVAAFAEAGHRSELVRLPVAWERGRLFDAPLAWRSVPIDADLVIATNFPSYFVRHPRKVVWLFHQHRGAYDAVDSSWSDFELDDVSLADQARLSDWDTRALEEATRIFSTSQVVADRLARFNGLQATPLYHPPPLHKRLRPGPFGDYVFCPTRLEANKRPGVVVRATSKFHSSTRSIIAGRGSMELELDSLASGIPAVEMLGFVSDDELVERFVNALAVVYVPADEDYGYVTLQAFYAGKPVITAQDSGGVLEWVEDGVTGIVTDGSPEEVADAVDRLASDPALAKKMGDAGRDRVRSLDWPTVVERLTTG